MTGQVKSKDGVSLTLDVGFAKVVALEQLQRELSDVPSVLGVSTGDYGAYKTIVHCAPDADDSALALIRERVEAHVPRPDETTTDGDESIEAQIGRLSDPLLRNILLQIVKMIGSKASAPSL